MRRLRRYYGSTPLHLLVLIAGFTVAGYAAARTAADSRWPLMLLWFVGALLGHDLILFPLYALADRLFTKTPQALERRPKPTTLVPALNYIRVPALGAALTLIVFLPGIVRQGADSYQRATGLTQQPFLARWLLVTAAMFALSAVTYVIRAIRMKGRRPAVQLPAEQHSTAAVE